MIGGKFGHIFDGPLRGIARKVPFSPNSISIAGFLVTAAAGFILVKSLFWGALLVLAGSAFDIFDGVVARTNNRTSSFGAFLDSVLDRYSDAFIFCGAAWNLHRSGNDTGAILSVFSLVGALLVSYVRARAEGVGIKCDVGIMERPERIVLFCFGALTGIVVPSLWLMLLLTHLTVIQRIVHVRRRL